MSREIEFRGQTRRKGERVFVGTDKPVDSNWVYGGIFQGEGAFSIIYSYEPIEKHTVYTDTVGQYVGLDKNGTKIFEGDIVKIYWKDNVLTIGDIKYDEKLCRFVICEDFAYPYGFDNTTPFEVIGNRWDNPELLGE